MEDRTELELALAALAEIRRKVHAHNRGGGISLTLRREIRDIADAALAIRATPVSEREEG